MRLQISLSATLEMTVDAPALLQIEAAAIDNFQTVCSSELTITPAQEHEPEQFFDLYGNTCRRLMLRVGENRVDYRATVEQPDERPVGLIAPVETDVMELPKETLHYLLPSRYCPSDRMFKLAPDMFSHHKPGYGRVLAICEWINEHVTYQYGTSNSSTSSMDTLIDRQGVCRDFAHLAISFCRAMNIPARYVSGYCLDLSPPDFHAYFQAFLDGRWVSFDATELQPRPALVEVAVGRDAADCAWCTIYGWGQTNELKVDVQLVQK